MNIYEFYTEELEKKKTISSKKAFLTKAKKQTEEHLKDLLEHKKPHGNMKFGYLHGKPVTAIRIAKVKTELKVIENIQKKLLNESGLKSIKPDANYYKELEKIIAKLETNKDRVEQSIKSNFFHGSYLENLKKDLKMYQTQISDLKKKLKNKKTPAQSIKLVWKKHPDGGEIANYKFGSITRYNKTYQINYFGTIGMISENASSLVNAKQKLDKISQSKIKKQNGMKAPAKTPAKRKKVVSAKKICRMVIDVPGINKRTGQLLKGWHYVKGKPVKVTKAKPAAKKTTAKKGLKAQTSKQTAAQKAFKANAAKARELVKSGKAKTLKSAWSMIKK